MGTYTVYFIVLSNDGDYVTEPQSISVIIDKVVAE